MHNQRVLVTGGAGFIGSNLANRLAADNDVIAVDDTYLPERPRILIPRWSSSRPMSSTTTSPPTSTWSSTSPRSPRGTCTRAIPSAAAASTSRGSSTVVERARETGSETVVYASTSSIYGSRTEPSPESMAVEAHTAYEASKLARERYAEYYANHYDMAMAGLRFFSVYQGFGGNEKHKGEYANTVAQFADAIAHDETPELFGDGTQTRDFTHVSDVARACELAADHELTGVYNIGTEEAYSFNEMIDLINDALGTDVDPAYIECPFDGYVHDTMADASAFRAATGWEPEIDFEEGVELVCRPYRDE